MNILLINPNSNSKLNNELLEKANLLVKDNEIQIDIVGNENAPKMIRTYEEAALTAPFLINTVKEKNEKYDAFILACHSDPNIEAVKEVSTKLVIGFGEASFKLASVYGKRIGVLVASRIAGIRKQDVVRKYYMEDQVKSYIEVDIEDYNQILSKCLESIKKDNIDVIILGAAGLSIFKDKLEKDINIPIMDGLICSLILTYGFLKFNNLSAYRYKTI